MTHNKVNS